DLGEYRLYWITPGKYFLRADYPAEQGGGLRSPNEFVGPAEDAYVPSYYPGTSDPASASAIELLPGALMSAIDLTMVRTKTYTVRGRAIVKAANPSTMRP